MAVITSSLPAVDPVVETAAEPARRRRRVPSPLFWFAVGWLALVVFLALFADVLPFVKDPFRNNAAIARMKPFHAKAWFGGDQNGRDIFSYCVYGARASLIIGMVTTALGMVIGGVFGLIAGYFRGWWDTIISGVSDVLLSFPALLLLIALTSFWGRDIYKIIIGLTILSVAPLSRLVRASTLVYAEREFVTAAKALGAKKSRILMREILPNVLPIALAFSLLAVALIIVAEGTLAFLGVGLKSTIASWGTLITQGRNDLRRFPHIVMMPSIVLVLTVLSLNVVGEKLRSRFDVRESSV